MTEAAAMDDRLKNQIGMHYDGACGDLVHDRAVCRDLLCQMNKYAGSYLQVIKPDEFKAYMQIRKKALPNLHDSAILERGFNADYGYNIYGGKHSIISFNCTMLDTAKIVIGDGVYIAPNVVIATASHSLNPAKRVKANDCKSRPIVIENNVWLCSNVTVCYGVRIGVGSVVLPNICVTSDVPPGMLVSNDNMERIEQFSLDDIQSLLQ